VIRYLLFVASFCDAEIREKNRERERKEETLEVRLKLINIEEGLILNETEWFSAHDRIIVIFILNEWYSEPDRCNNVNTILNVRMYHEISVK